MLETWNTIEELEIMREQMYEEIKDLTIEERLARLKAETDPIIEQFHIKRSTLTPVIPYKRQREPLRPEDA